METKDTLYFFTSEYPYGNSETSFIKPELEFLAQKFGKIYLIPDSILGEAQPLPENVSVIDLKTNEKLSFFCLVRFYFFCASILFREYTRCSNKKKFLSTLREQVAGLRSFYKKAFGVINLLKTHKKSDNAIFYTYWFDGWTTTLCLVKRLGVKLKIVTRAHGFDLYTERSKNGFIYFREFQLKFVDKVFLISSQGFDYFINKHSGYRNKAVLSRLGTKYSGINLMENTPEFTLVSCSNYAPVKRVYLIAEILQHVQFKMKWIHIGGGGNDYEKIMQAKETLLGNVKVEFLGEIENDKVLEFYNNTPVNLLINVSESEGLPVSFMEAISFGIPVMATDVGGVRDIINEQTGILIPKDFNATEVARAIFKFKEGSMNTMEYRPIIRNFWQQHFSAENNYNTFYSKMRE